jgi:hypothetical protein
MQKWLREMARKDLDERFKLLREVLKEIEDSRLLKK